MFEIGLKYVLMTGTFKGLTSLYALMLVLLTREETLQKVVQRDLKICILIQYLCLRNMYWR